MSYLLALLAGLAGAILGWMAAAMLGIGIAGALGVSDFEGAAGMFAVFGAGPVGALFGLAIGVVLVLRKRGHRSFAAIMGRSLVVLALLAGFGGGGIKLLQMWQDDPGRNGPKPVAEFEIRAPKGFEIERQGLSVALHTDSAAIPADLRSDGPSSHDGHAIVKGGVALDARAARRILVLSLPHQPNRLFQLDLPATPKIAAEFGTWRKADFIDDPATDRAPRKAPDGDGFEIRVRVPDWNPASR